jgi:hypothetical protein
MTFIRPVWAGLLAVSVGLVPGPAHCPGAGAAERPQEILYFFRNFRLIQFFSENFKHKLDKDIRLQKSPRSEKPQ